MRVIRPTLVPHRRGEINKMGTAGLESAQRFVVHRDDLRISDQCRAGAMSHRHVQSLRPVVIRTSAIGRRSAPESGAAV
jgi:hypothetical protein